MKKSFLAILAVLFLALSTSSTHAANFPSEAADLQAAWNLMAQCRPVYDGHRFHAMWRVTDAGKIIGINLPGFRSGTLTKEQARPKLAQARDLIQKVQSSLAAKKKPVAADLCARAVRQLNLALAVP